MMRDFWLIGRVGGIRLKAAVLDIDDRSGYSWAAYCSDLSPLTSETSAMFRGVTSVILILGILLCPLYCSAAVVSVSATTQSQCSGNCCGCGGDQSTGERGNGPQPCHDGCSRDCVCKGLLKGHVQSPLARVGFWRPFFRESHIIAPASLTLLPETARTRGPTRSDLCCGAAIRLAFSSLLI